MVHVRVPAARWVLEAGALVMATETELILKSRKVEPRRLIESGFRFAYPHWQQAAADLCGAERRRHD
jgi:uncharacterized protein